MQGAAFALVVNIAVAGMFAASFAILALSNPSRRSALWFAASYAVGMLTPLSQFLLPVVPWPQVMAAVSYLSFSAALTLMAVALAIFYRQPVPWRLAGGLFIFSMVMMVVIRDGRRNWLPHELSYQLPSTLSTALSCWIVSRVAPRRFLETTLAWLLGLLSAHFIAKAFLAVIFDSGPTAVEYQKSLYALISQAGTGIFLIATGLLVLLVVVQGVISDAKAIADTDALSGLPNRRGFDERSARILAEAARVGQPVAVAQIDLDLFKQINDTYGHAVGDEVIRRFGRLLKRSVPESAVVGRTGGEEFAILFERTTAEGARLNLEAIRIATAHLADDLPPLSISAGVTRVYPGEALSIAIRRADAALYEAKSRGRNRVCLADRPEKPSNVTPFRLKA